MQSSQQDDPASLGHPLPWPAERVGADARIDPDELEAVLEPASPEPKVLGDAKLWLDWLRFLEGAAVNGGLLVRP